MKTCSKCGEVKEVSQFRKKSDTHDGLRPQYKACSKISDAKYRADNTEKVKAANSKWCAENRESGRAASAKWRSKNLEKAKAASSKWHADNPEKAKALNAKWRAEHPKAGCIKEQNRRAIKRASGGTLSKGLAAKLFKLQRGKCACGCRQPLGDDYHLDHRMPLALGGSNTDDNMQLLRKRCNLQKHAKHPVDFMQQRGFLL